MSLKPEPVCRRKRFNHFGGGLSFFLGIIMIGAGVNSVPFTSP
jgi:hypothetical protein